MAHLQVGEIFRREPPLDFRVAGESACAGAGHISENAIKFRREGQIPRIGGDDVDIAGSAPVAGVVRAQQLSQQARAVGMEIDRSDFRVGIAIGDSCSFPSRRRATIENIDRRGRPKLRRVARLHPE